MKKTTMKLAGAIRRAAAAGLALCVFCGVSGQAQAAALKDVFDEHYYADTYTDLKEAFGYNKDALWKHFITYGVQEGRNMNGLLNVVEYKKMYPDLEKAFGDNWDAYLTHYLTFGAKEGRDTGTEFNVMDYAGRYEDLQKIYGNDILALWEHYRTFGAEEGREARSEEIVEAEQEEEDDAQQEADDAQEPDKPQEPENPDEPSISGTRTERVELDNGRWRINEYDEAEKLVKSTEYMAEGSIDTYNIYEYYSNGNRRKIKTYYSSGNIMTIHDFNEAGKTIMFTNYYEKKDGSVYKYSTQEYLEGGGVELTIYNENGEIISQAGPRG